MPHDNTDQVAHWNGPGGLRWVTHQATLDRALEPFGHIALDGARPRPGERIVDVGCGCGWTTLALAEAVGTGGKVFGIDVSEPMVARARERARAFTTATLAIADASTYAFAREFDLVFSRFGVMFFHDPTAAFTNLRGALRSGGRLAFVCWGPAAENPWWRIPVAAAGTVVPLPAPPGPDDPGPFAFANCGRVQRILEGAGFSDVAFTRAAPDYLFGSDLEAASTSAVETGPASRLLLDADDATRARARAAIQAALEPYSTARGVMLPTSTWVVRATACA
jgi:SAM-dependent methyltransferase